MLWEDFSWPFRIGWVDLISGLQGNGALLFGFDSDLVLTVTVQSIQSVVLI